MTNNSILQLIGQKSNIFLSESQATQVDNIFSDNSISPDFVIRLKNPSISFKKGAIRTIEINTDLNKHADKEKSMGEFYEEEKNNRIKYLLFTKEKLSSFTDIFEGLFKVSSGENPSQEDINKAKEIQLKFFRENVNRTLCDLHLLKPLIPMRRQMISPFSNSFFRLAEKAVFRDMQLSGQLKENIKLPVIKKAVENETITQMKFRAEDNRKSDENFNDVISHALSNF